MSNHCWERGTIILPGPDARRIRSVFAAAQDQHRQQVIAEIDAFYKAKGSGGRTRETFDAAVKAWSEHRYPATQPRQASWGSQPLDHGTARIAVSSAHDFLARRAHAGQFAKPGKREVDAHVQKLPRSGKVTIYCGADATITLDGNNLHWDVPSNNHAVDHAREHPFARRMFAELAKVKWTNRTGGEILGNDEYNEHAGRAYEGGGSTYKRGGYGPLGDEFFVSDAQKAGLQKSAATWRSKPGNAGKCGLRTIVNGKRTGPPCKNSAYACPVHRRNASGLRY